MSNYSVADAKSGLPKLIDSALQGEEVIITRHGRPVAELRPITASASRGHAATYAWMRAQRARRNSVDITSVELLNQMYDEPEA